MDHVRYGVAVSGRAAFLLARLIDPRQLERRLDNAGIRGSNRAEQIRAEVMETVELLRERGAAWHEAQRREDTSFNRAFNERRGASDGGSSDGMFIDIYTTSEVAEVLGVTPQRVGQLRDEGHFDAIRSDGGRGRWLYAAGEVRAYKEWRDGENEEEPV
jgi:Helix-turn-helix domain